MLLLMQPLWSTNKYNINKYSRFSFLLFKSEKCLDTRGEVACRGYAHLCNNTQYANFIRKNCAATCQLCGKNFYINVFGSTTAYTNHYFPAKRISIIIKWNRKSDNDIFYRKNSCFECKLRTWKFPLCRIAKYG